MPSSQHSARDLHRRYARTYIKYGSDIAYVEYIEEGDTGPVISLAVLDKKTKTHSNSKLLEWDESKIADLRPPPGFINKSVNRCAYIAYGPARQWSRSVTAASSMLQMSYGNSFSTPTSITTKDVINFMLPEYVPVDKAYALCSDPKFNGVSKAARAFDREFAFVGNYKEGVKLFYNQCFIGIMRNGFTLRASLKLRKNVRRKLSVHGITVIGD